MLLAVAASGEADGAAGLVDQQRVARKLRDVLVDETEAAAGLARDQRAQRRDVLPLAPRGSSHGLARLAGRRSRRRRVALGDGEQRRARVSQGEPRVGLDRGREICIRSRPVREQTVHAFLESIEGDLRRRGDGETVAIGDRHDASSIAGRAIAVAVRIAISPCGSYGRFDRSSPLFHPSDDSPRRGRRAPRCSAHREGDGHRRGGRGMRSPIPTRIVSSDEYQPPPQTAAQREVEARLQTLGATLARRHAMTRRRFFQTAAGMAAAYHVMNQVYGPLFEAPAAEAAAPDLAAERARGLAGQVIFDAHTHFVRDDPSRVHADTQRAGGLLWQRMLIAQLGWNADLAGKAQTVDDLKFGNFVKEIYLDSDTKVALLTNAPSDVPQDW